MSIFIADHRKKKKLPNRIPKDMLHRKKRKENKDKYYNIFKIGFNNKMISKKYSLNLKIFLLYSKMANKIKNS